MMQLVLLSMNYHWSLLQGDGSHRSPTHKSNGIDHSTQSPPLPGLKNSDSVIGPRDYFLYKQLNILRLGPDFQNHRDNPKCLFNAQSASDPIRTHRRVGEITNFAYQMQINPYSFAERPIQWGNGTERWNDVGDNKSRAGSVQSVRSVKR